ncbi:cupin-like domain-containing protein [Chryseobacterium gleum]|uniref:cupin-like domain-containing protein n=1 Tax=Chryseobacterium gleum TaxID=250 RepID=UPI0028AAC542|nr:cupin-like domain-containing protein [Chryseobacterium gleum]
MQQLIDQIHKNKLTSISEDLSGSIEEKDFNQQYAYPKIPVIFRNAYQTWDIKDKWTLPYLISKLSNTETVENIDRVLNLETYLQTENTNNVYYKTQQHLTNELSLDYSVPEELRCWYKNHYKKPKLFLSWLYVGMQNTFSELHQDIWNTSAWNYLIKGRKLWFFFPVSLNSIIKNNIDSYKVENIIDAIFSRDSKFQPLYCIQNEGELVYSPPGFYHAVINLDLTISLTENFINKTNYDTVFEHFKKELNDSSIKSLLNIIEYNLKIEKNGSNSQ